MCQLCSNDKKERDADKARLKEQAERLEKMAAHLRALAAGQIKPHGVYSESYTLIARNAIRYLVEEWM